MHSKSQLQIVGPDFTPPRATRIGAEPGLFSTVMRTFPRTAGAIIVLIGLALGYSARGFTDGVLADPGALMAEASPPDAFGVFSYK